MRRVNTSAATIVTLLVDSGLTYLTTNVSLHTEQAALAEFRSDFAARGRLVARTRIAMRSAGLSRPGRLHLPSFESALSKGSNSRQEVAARSTFVAGGPADKIGPQTKEHEDALGTSGPCLEATVGPKAARRSRLEGRRWCDEATAAPRTHPPRLALAGVIS